MSNINLFQCLIDNDIESLNKYFSDNDANKFIEKFKEDNKKHKNNQGASQLVSTYIGIYTKNSIQYILANKLNNIDNYDLNIKLYKFFDKINFLMQETGDDYPNQHSHSIVMIQSMNNFIIKLINQLDTTNKNIDSHKSVNFKLVKEIDIQKDIINNLQDEIKQNKLKILQLETNNYNRTKLINSSFKILYIVCNILVLCIILYKFQIYIY